ncbi:MAG: hypothetical protein IJV94_04600 [Bacilli bacterium]|nr:hypothetical protein [Bacilli bacterium]
MEQYDSYLLQALATTGLIVALDKKYKADNEYFNKIEFDNNSLKNIIKRSKISNPATLQMFLYALLVAPYEMNKEHKLNIEFDKLNQYIKNHSCKFHSNYSYGNNEITYIKHLRNSISHSKCFYFKSDNKCFVTFSDQDNYNGRNWKCDFTMRTEDVGELLEEIQRIIFKYFKTKYPERCI